jgi:SAM-dependent methyltransferase
MRRAADGVELLDRPTSPADREASLADIDRLNAWFGGHALTLRHVARALSSLGPGEPFRVLDVGAGRGDLAVRLVRWARRRRLPIRVIALDPELDSASLARRTTADFPEISVVRGDGTALPVRTAGLHLVVSSLTLHHLPPDAAVRALGEMARAGRLGFVVNDLWRTRLGLVVVWLATRVLARHPISRHDGPLSVRRSYSPRELRALAARAGVSRMQVRRYPGLLRVVAIGSHPA